MVHALHEAHRVLRPDGLLLDLRPGRKHRRIGLQRADGWRPVGVMRERFDEDRAANAAMAQVLRQGLFRREGFVQFELSRQMDTLEDFRAWIDEFVQLADLPPHDWLIERVERALAEERGRARIVASGPLALRVMRKIGVRERPVPGSRTPVHG